MPPPADYETIAPEERLRRIGRLLCKAAVLALARREAGEVSKENDLSAQRNSDNQIVKDCLLNTGELELLRRARHLGGVSPREAAQLWKVSRATTYRRLSSLEGRGWIARHGATTATRYGLTRQALDGLEKEDSRWETRQPDKNPKTVWRPLNGASSANGKKDLLAGKQHHAER